MTTRLFQDTGKSDRAIAIGLFLLFGAVMASLPDLAANERRRRRLMNEDRQLHPAGFSNSSTSWKGDRVIIHHRQPGPGCPMLGKNPIISCLPTSAFRTSLQALIQGCLNISSLVWSLRGLAGDARICYPSRTHGQTHARGRPRD
jgi:hypothetical protein